MITQETLNDMDEYINKLKKVRKEMVVQSLIESGVFNEDGTPKENIVDRR